MIETAPAFASLLVHYDPLVTSGKDVIAGYVKSKGTTAVASGNRLTLLRDGNGDGSLNQYGETPHALAVPTGAQAPQDGDSQIEHKHPEQGGSGNQIDGTA